MTRAEIIEKVKQKLDEVQAYDAYATGGVNLIDKFLDEAAETVLNLLPLHLIPPSDFSDQSQDARSDGSGLIQLPDDFLRLSSFKLAEWDRAVTVPISKSNPKYNLQKNTVTRGKPFKPVVVIGYYDVGADSGDVTGFRFPGYYSGAYGWDNVPTNAQIAAVVGDPADYSPADNFLIHDTAFVAGPTAFYVFSDGVQWFVNAANFIPAA